MLHLFTLALVTSSDSLFAGILCSRSLCSVTKVAYLFALCDSLALWIGLLLPVSPQLAEALLKYSALFLTPLGLLLVFVIVGSPKQEILTWVIYIAPPLLAVDNFAAAPAFADRGVSAAFCVPLAAATSGGLYLVGNCLATVARLVCQKIVRFMFSAQIANASRQYPSG